MLQVRFERLLESATMVHVVIDGENRCGESSIVDETDTPNMAAVASAALAILDGHRYLVCSGVRARGRKRCPVGVHAFYVGDIPSGHRDSVVAVPERPRICVARARIELPAEGREHVQRSACDYDWLIVAAGILFVKVGILLLGRSCLPIAACQKRKRNCG